MLKSAVYSKKINKVDSTRILIADFKLSCYSEVKQQYWNFWVLLFSQVLAIPPGLTGSVFTSSFGSLIMTVNKTQPRKLVLLIWQVLKKTVTPRNKEISAARTPSISHLITELFSNKLYFYLNALEEPWQRSPQCSMPCSPGRCLPRHSPSLDCCLIMSVASLKKMVLKWYLCLLLGLRCELILPLFWLNISLT